MEIIELHLEGAQNGRFGLFQGHDLHADLKAFDLAEFMRWRSAIMDFHDRGNPTVAIFPGDYIHARLPGDKFFDPEILRPHVLAHLNDYAGHMTEEVGSLIKPLVDKGVQVILQKGNHDAYLKELDIVRAIADYSGAIYGNTESLIRVVARDQYRKARVKTIYSAHGAGGGNNPGGRLNKARQSVFIADADAYLYGHIHNAVMHIESVPYLKTTGKPVLCSRERLYAYASSFVKGREQGVFDYPNAKSLPAVNTAKYMFTVDTWNDKFLPSRVV